MTGWTSEELTKIGAADDLEIASRRRDGSLPDDDRIDAAYRTKGRRYAASIVDHVVSPQARSATIKLVPRSTSS